MAIKRRPQLTATALRRFVNQPRVQKIYFIASIVVLGLTTVLWALVGSWIQAGNADQLANSYLLENGQTFGGAVLPDQHSFIFKLPFFWLIQLLGGSPAAFSFVTVLIVVLTVGLFAFILYKLQPQRLVMGTLYLALALVLIMIPAEPYGYSLLPTNMAMLTTRNLEYVLFIATLLLVVRSPKWVSGKLFLSFILTVLLIASDKLFLSIGIGGSILFALLSIIRPSAPLRTTALRWFTVSILGGIGALLLLHFITALNILHLDGHNIASPYGVIHSLKDGVIAVFYAVLGVFTNFGANPAYDSRTIVDFFSVGSPRILSVLSYAYVGTVTILVTVVVAAGLQIKKMFQKKTAKKVVYSPALILALMMIATSLAALGAFVVSSHYYPVDSRYLAIVLFAGFIVLATYPFKKRLPSLRLFIAGIIIGFILGPALLFPFHTLENYNQASHETRQRNDLISKTLALHKVDTLLGNYWRVLPIKSIAKQPQIVTPLSDCTTDRTVLGSSAWQLDLHNHSFAYLLTLDHDMNFPDCSLERITSIYGKPDSSVIVSGTTKNPKELLLFYDKGIHKTRSVNVNHQAPDTVVPISIENLPFRDCGDNGKTIMNFVAHEDDDILFMNPDVNKDIQAGNCVRSVFVTAGDAGSDAPYWIGRQKGAEAAYASMVHTPEVSWTERLVEVSPGHYVTVANPRNNHKISLIFLHLPDGNMNGSGFRGRGQSLARLYGGQVSSVQTVDKQSSYSSPDLQVVLTELMKAYLPNQVRSQSVSAGSGKYTDHSDHTTVGRFTSRALADYTASKPTIVPSVMYYFGYPVHGMPENVTGEDLDLKVKTFLEFARFDAATCSSLEICDHSTAYGAYLRRQYTNPI